MTSRLYFYCEFLVGSSSLKNQDTVSNSNQGNTVLRPVTRLLKMGVRATCDCRPTAKVDLQLQTI